MNRSTAACRFVTVALVAALAASCADEPATADRDYWPTNGWLTSTPEDQGMDSTVLGEMLEGIATADAGVDSVTIIRNGYMVLDTTFHPFPAATKHIIHSCTKSIVGTLIGMAIGDGLIKDVNERVVDLLPTAIPEAAGPAKADITVEHLLTMSSGLQCRDSYLYDWVGLNEMRASDDWAAHVLGLPMAEDPGTRFEYCNGSSHLLSAILSETGGSAFDYASQVLFKPLGIDDVYWPTNAAGANPGWGEIRMRPHDMAKLGYLYLNGGWWDDRRILSAGWVDAATSPQITAGTLNDSYGYQWWVDDETYSALGFGGQYIIVEPELDIVAVFTSGLAGSEFNLPRNLFDRFVVEGVVDDDPLPPDIAATERLNELMAEVSRPPEAIRPAALPILAAEVSGRRYSLDPNDGGFAWFEFDFGIDEARLLLEDPDGPIDVLVGLDGVPRLSDAWGNQWAFVGKWLTDNTFEATWQIIGRAARGTFEFTFSDTKVDFAFSVVTTGSVTHASGSRG
jgi:CubicO group peptidase (beta-lactamase class C family)